MKHFFLVISVLLSVSSWAFESPFRECFGGKLVRSEVCEEGMEELDKLNPIFRQNWTDFVEYCRQNPSCNCYKGTLNRQIIAELCYGYIGESKIFCKELQMDYFMEDEVYCDAEDLFTYFGLDEESAQFGATWGPEIDEEDEWFYCPEVVLTYLMFRYGFFYSSFRNSFLYYLTAAEEIHNKMYTYEVIFLGNWQLPLKFCQLFSLIT